MSILNRAKDMCDDIDTIYRNNFWKANENLRNYISYLISGGPQRKDNIEIFLSLENIYDNYPIQFTTFLQEINKPGGIELVQKQVKKIL